VRTPQTIAVSCRRYRIYGSYPGGCSFGAATRRRRIRKTTARRTSPYVREVRELPEAIWKLIRHRLCGARGRAASLHRAVYAVPAC
jgi:hypothetical protein